MCVYGMLTRVLRWIIVCQPKSNICSCDNTKKFDLLSSTISESAVISRDSDDDGDLAVLDRKEFILLKTETLRVI